jgi:Domain of unknown function (DUF4157)
MTMHSFTNKQTNKEAAMMNSTKPSPTPAPARPLNQLRGMLGNQAFGHVIQAKLQISQPGDAYELEADRVADQVMRTPDAALAEPVAGDAPPQISPLQRKCAQCEGESVPSHLRAEEKASGQIPIMAKGISGQSCESASSADQEEEETPVMTKAISDGKQEASGRLAERLSGARGGGGPLSHETRSFMEPRFGYDLGDVRVHTGSDAVQMTRDLNAEAFTSGKDVYFASGTYNPGTPTGMRLLAHELTHVIQQRQGDHSGDSVSMHAGAGNGMIQRYKLSGFPTAEEAAMNAAIPVAIDTVKKCDWLSWFGKLAISRAINNKRYDYKEDLGICGWTFPASWYIEIGKKAFDKSKCCDLPSTIAHEASHTEFYTEGRARKMECNCFGCSC